MKRWLVIPLMGACASTTQAPSPAPSDNSAMALRTEAPDPGPLSGAGIPSGRCGMILWTRDGSRVSPIFRELDGIEATMRLEGNDVPLTLQSQHGELRLGIRANQLFTAQGEQHRGVTVETKLSWGQGFPGGTYVKGGTLSVSGADGWVRILPVAGIAGCKA